MDNIFIAKRVLLTIATRKSVGILASLLILLSTPVFADILGTDINGRPVILRNDGTWSYIDNPDRDKACRHYADVAVKQNGVNLSLKCGFTGQLWSPNNSYHYDWCMNVTVADTQKGFRDRDDALTRCKNIANNTNTQAACSHYAKVAVSQNEVNLRLKCGFTGQLWNPNNSYHYDWCMNVTVADTQKGFRDRDDALTRCGSIPQPTGNYLGCFKDQGDAMGTSGRDLNGHGFNSNKMTNQLCMSECRALGFNFAGTQATYWCFCGNSYGRSGEATNCNLPCPGDHGEICGGAWANSVYKVGP